MKTLFVLVSLIAVLFVVPFVYGQETPSVLEPNQLFTYSLAPGQEKLFVLPMKKGDFADIQSLVREGLYLSFEIYDSTRKELLEKSAEGDPFVWFVAPRDGDFILVSRFTEYQSSENSGAQRVSIQYNNKFKLPIGTKLKSVRKVKGFDVKIMTTPESSEGRDSVLLIEKNGQLQKAMKVSGGTGFYFAGEIDRFSSAKEKRSFQLIQTTVDKKGNGIPDIMIEYNSGGNHCCNYNYFFDLGDTVRMIEPVIAGLLAIGRNSKGGLLFEEYEYSFAMWLNAGCGACARPSNTRVILEFRNGVLRPNFDLMKKPAPSLAVLRSKVERFRNQLSLKPYRGADSEPPGLLYSGIVYADNEDADDRQSQSPIYGDLNKKRVHLPGGNVSPQYQDPFWDEMIDLIYTGNEEIAWQFLDLIWPPTKQGKAIFINDFKNQLSQSRYWQMISEDYGIKSLKPTEY